jgi:hypothetical protein
MGDVMNTFIILAAVIAGAVLAYKEGIFGTSAAASQVNTVGPAVPVNNTAGIPALSYAVPASGECDGSDVEVGNGRLFACVTPANIQAFYAANPTWYDIPQADPIVGGYIGSAPAQFLPNPAPGPITISTPILTPGAMPLAPQGGSFIPAQLINGNQVF